MDRVRVMLLRRERLREETVDQNEGPRPEPAMEVSHVRQPIEMDSALGATVVWRAL